MQQVKIVKLGEICETYGGGTPPREVSEYFGGDIFWITPTEIPKDRIGKIDSSRETLTRKGLENSSAKLLPKGAVLMTSRASIGNIGITNVPVATNQGFVSFVCGPSVQNTYLAYYLLNNKNKFENAANGATFKEIPRSTVRKFEIALPGLDLQRHIAAVLDKADALRQKDRQLLAYYEQLPQAVFLEMFGDPVRNEKGWEVKKFGELGEARLGKMLDAKQQSGNHRFPYLGNSNVQWGRFNLVNLSEMDFNEKDRVEFALKYGDLLVCEGGEVGRAAIWREEMSNCFFQKAIHRVRLKADVATPEYAQSLLKLFAERNGFKDFVTVATIAHLTGVKLKSIPVPVPPIKEQQHFGNIHADLCTQISKAKQQLVTSEALFQSLSHE